MLKQETTICNKLGLHARASAKLVDTASKFTSEVVLHKNFEIANAKSIMGIMMLAASFGTKLTITAEGSDEATAMATVIELINNKFGED